MTSSLRARITGSTLLVTAVALVVALNTGLVPLPYSTPRAGPAAIAALGESEAAATDPAAARDDAVGATVSAVSAALLTGAATDAYAHPSVPVVAAALARLVRNVKAVPGATASLDRNGAALGPTGAVGDLPVRLRLTSQVVANEAAAYELIDASFRQVGERWLLASWAPIVDPDEKVPQTPFLQPVEILAVRTQHALLLGTAGTRRFSTRLAARVEGAAVQARAVLPKSAWDGRVVVYAFIEQAFLDRVFGPGTAGVRDQSPDSWWSSETSDGTLRVTLGAGYVAVDDADSRFGVKRAVGYAAGLAADGSGVPDWMLRGFSEYVATRSGDDIDPAAALDRRGLDDATWRAVRQGSWTPRLVGEDSESTTDAQRGAAADAAWLAWLFVADRYGEAELQQAWEAAADSTGTIDIAERDALKSLGTTRATFVHDLQTWTRRLVARS